MLSVRKLMETVFWDRMMKFVQQEITLKSDVYCGTVTKRLLRIIQNQRCGMLTSNIVHLHNNVHPHRVARTRALLENFDWVFDHLPCSPGLALSDYHPATYLKNWLGPQRFNSNEELMEGVETWLSSQTADFSDTGIQKLIPRYNTCISFGDDFIEK
jgi:hypothetical protein